MTSPANTASERQKDSSTKYALLSYDTLNIGDEIQSIAAMRFLPRVDYLVNRDNIDQTHPTDPHQEVKLILNGYFLNPSINDHKRHWPPANPHLSPLIISMHIAFQEECDQDFKTSESIEFLKKFAPIGTRDTATADFLDKLGVPAYFSGCLTLTLIPDPKVQKQDFVLAIDVSDKVYDAIKQRTKRFVIRLDTLHTAAHSPEERMALAKYWLFLYQSAHCIVTTRLHSMLPSLALQTPVIAIYGHNPERYSGLLDLLNHYTESEFLSDPISIDRPKPNPTTYQKLRDEIVKTCAHYTGYDSKESYLQGQTPTELLLDPHLITVFTQSIKDVYTLEDSTLWQQHDLKNLNLKLEEVTRELQHTREESEQRNHNLYDTKIELEKAKNPGVKSATKILARSIKRSLQSRLKVKP